jgi:hypothetical protein
MPQTYTFGATGLLAAVPTGWKRTSGPSANPQQLQRANALDEQGVEIAAKNHSPVIAWDETFVAVNDTLVIPALGKQTAGPAISAIKIATGLQYAVMTISLVDGPAGDKPNHIYAHGVTLDKAFGAYDFLGGTAGTAKLISGNVDITMQTHTAFDGAGNALAVELSGGTVQATSTYMNTPTTPCGALFTLLSAKNDTTNQDWYKYDVTGSLVMPAV